MSESRAEYFPSKLGEKDVPWWKKFLKIALGAALAGVGIQMFVNSTADLFPTAD